MKWSKKKYIICWVPNFHSLPLQIYFFNMVYISLIDILGITPVIVKHLMPQTDGTHRLCVLLCECFWLLQSYAA